MCASQPRSGLDAYARVRLWAVVCIATTIVCVGRFCLERSDFTMKMARWFRDGPSPRLGIVGTTGPARLRNGQDKELEKKSVWWPAKLALEKGADEGRDFLPIESRVMRDLAMVRSKLPCEGDLRVLPNLTLTVVSVSACQTRMRWRREGDSNPRDGCPPTRVPGVRLQPLGHLSSLRCGLYRSRFQAQAHVVAASELVSIKGRSGASRRRGRG